MTQEMVVKMIHVLDLTFDLNEAKNYYHTLENHYHHLKWEFRKDHNDPAMIDPKNMVDDVQGWGLQTIYSDPNFVYHCDLDPHDESYEYFKDTGLVFGFFKKVKEKFTNPFRSFLFKFPPNNYIDKAIPAGPPHCKIQIVLESNDKAKIVSHGIEKQESTLIAGKIYLTDTDQGWELWNNGDTDLILFNFNLPNEYILQTLLLKGTI
jgi:hypothetical protein